MLPSSFSMHLNIFSPKPSCSVHYFIIRSTITKIEFLIFYWELQLLSPTGVSHVEWTTVQFIALSWCQHKMVLINVINGLPPISNSNSKSYCQYNDPRKINAVSTLRQHVHRPVLQSLQRRQIDKQSSVTYFMGSLCVFSGLCVYFCVYSVCTLCVYAVAPLSWQCTPIMYFCVYSVYSQWGWSSWLTIRISSSQWGWSHRELTIRESVAHDGAGPHRELSRDQ
jgi:hypothetical protein